MKIQKLIINNFRQFSKKEIEFDGKWTIITAPNTRGKSTIIEALYMLADGKSPWTNSSTNIIRLTSKNQKQNENTYTKLTQKFCRIEAEIETDDEIESISIVLENNHHSTTKQFTHKDKKVSLNKFIQIFHTVLFSPDLIDLLMFEPRQRREYLNDQISQLNPDYRPILNNYQRVLRQRNSLLKYLSRQRHNGSANHPNSIKFWTEQLLELGAQITLARLEFINKLNSTEQQLYQAQVAYEPSIKLDDIEELANKSYIKDVFKKQITNSKSKELNIGVTLVGPHRDDWYLDSSGQNLNIHGSRGEKRLAIADIIFKMNLLLGHELEQPPIILLDDVASELDKDNTLLLFNEKISKEQQVVITTTDIKSIPPNARKISQIIEL
ncbi:MAG: DNA replication and repair protein RecF [Patescibacteria group bacterium]|nr:DNA replication and repair protein RecF [Patescibacteria group bacterium]